MHLHITDPIFELFPDLVLGVIVVRDIDNTGESDQIMQRLRREESRVRETLANVQLTTHPQIVPWREAYRAFGAKPKETPSSIENLLRRVSKGYELPHINTLVDLYNGVSLHYLLPVGGEDLDAIRGDVLLRCATEDEAPVRLLGETEARPPKPGEVIYADEIGAICRRWNWKEAERSKLTNQTRNAVLVIEGLPPIERDLIDRATNELAELVTTHCGGSATPTILDRGNPRADLGSQIGRGA